MAGSGPLHDKVPGPRDTPPMTPAGIGNATDLVVMGMVCSGLSHSRGILGPHSAGWALP